MSNVSARSKLVNFSPEKNLTSNRPKPIGVLTRSKSSCSDDRLPLGYLLTDFQPHRSNFFIRSKKPLREWKWSQIECSIVEHFQTALNPYGFWTAQNEVRYFYIHTFSYSLRSFERFLMAPLNARSTLVNFSLTKNLASNGSKPIRVLTRTTTSCSDDCLPLGYLLPDF